MGDEGLRQAKMTYRPAGFIKKYRAALYADILREIGSGGKEQSSKALKGSILL